MSIGAYDAPCHDPACEACDKTDARSHFPVREFTPRVTDECLDRMIQSPTPYAAWVLRAALVELRNLRQALSSTARST